MIVPHRYAQIVVRRGHGSRRSPERSVPVKSLSDMFRRAQRRAGISDYDLRMVRPRALTDEALRAGKPTDKGGHKTESMRAHYVRERVPMVVRNTLGRIG